MPIELPTVTVVVNAHLRAVLLKRQLEAVLAQEFSEPWDVFVAHDGPPDDATVKVGKEMSERFRERGIPFAFAGIGDEESGYYGVPCNHAIAHSAGEFLMFLDDDNIIEPGTLQALWDAHMEGEEWPDFTYGRRRYRRDPGCPTHSKDGIELKEGESPHVEWTPDAVQALGASALNNFIDKGDFMISRGACWLLALNTQMMWNEAMRRFGDWEFICRAAWFGGLRGKAVDKIVQTYCWTGQNLQLTRPLHETPRPVEV